MVAVPAQRRAGFLPAIIFIVGMAVISPMLSFVSPFSCRSSRAVRIGARASGAELTTSDEKNIKWQHGLDQAVLDLDASIPQKMRGIRSVWDNRENVVETFKEVAMLIREKGTVAQTEILDRLFPRGTYVRADIDSVINLIQSVRRQVPDIEPELEKLRLDLEKLAPQVQSELPKELQGLADETAKRVLPIGVDKATGDAATLFREVQSHEREELAYLTVKETRGFEVRVYQPYPSLKRVTSDMTKAFTDLVNYLKKQQPRSPSMKAAMPVMIDYDSSKPNHVAKAMTFVLESIADISRAESDSNIAVKRNPMHYFAARNVIGATDAEVQVQLNELRAALKKDGQYKPVSDDQYSVMQYYHPGAALWRRKTEVGFAVKPV